MNKSLHNYRMGPLYQMIGITKQGHYKRLQRRDTLDRVQNKILDLALGIRKDHKRMGCRKLYDEIGHLGMGRDRVEQLLLENGFRVAQKRSFHRTTYAGRRRYANLISGELVKGSDQVYVSDITYIPVSGNRFYYLTLVLDVYTRMIKGWSLSNALTTEQTVYPAFKMAIAGLTEEQLKLLVFHSDRGSQYGSDLMKRAFEKSKVNPSMGGKAWENAHAESLNGILKNEYINCSQSNLTLNQVEKLMKKWIYLYNHKRPHGSLKNRKPSEYETYLQGLALEDKPGIRINY